MQAKQVDRNRWMLVLDRGEEVVSTVTEFLVKNQIRSGFVRGLGSLKNHVVAFYDLPKQEYLRRTFEENMELGNLIGSIGVYEGKPFLHAHVTVSGPELIAFTGHLVKGEVAITVELLIEGFDEEVLRRPVEEVGLALIDLREDVEEEETAIPE